MIRIEMEDGGVIELELYPDIAPLTAANFEKLAKEGFYEEKIIWIVTGITPVADCNRLRQQISSVIFRFLW